MKNQSPNALKSSSIMNLLSVPEQVAYYFFGGGLFIICSEYMWP